MEVTGQVGKGEGHKDGEGRAASVVFKFRILILIAGYLNYRILYLFEYSIKEGDCVDNEIDFDASADSVIAGVANTIATARIANIGEFRVADNIMI